MKSLEEVLLCEAYEPENYGGAAQGKGFYILIDGLVGSKHDGETDVTINGNKITIKEKSPISRGTHRAYICFEKAGNYNIDIQADCDIDLQVGGACKINNLQINTTGKPLAAIYVSNQKVVNLDLSNTDTGYLGLDGVTALKNVVGPKSKECGFRIAKCSNLESVDLSNIINTPTGKRDGGAGYSIGRLYIRNCKKLSVIDFPQAIGMDLQLEKLPLLNDATKNAAQALCDKCGAKFIDMI